MHFTSLTFVSSHLVAGTTNGSQGALAQNHVPQNAVGVGPLDAIQIDHGPLRGGDALPRILLNLATLIRGGSTINDEGKVIVGRDAKRQGVGAQHGLDAKGWGNRGTGVGTRQPDATGVGGHGGVVSRDAIMRGILHGHETDSVLLGLLDGHVHGVRADVQPQAEVAIEKGGGFRLLEDVDGLVGEEDAVVHAVALRVVCIHMSGV